MSDERFEGWLASEAGGGFGPHDATWARRLEEANLLLMSRVLLGLLQSEWVEFEIGSSPTR